MIVGAGQAGVQLCLALRKEKFEGSVTLYGAETDYPYHRPPLSKSYLTGKDDDAKLPMRPPSFYTSKAIDIRLSEEVKSINTGERTVTSKSGSQSYDHLVLATGARPRQLSIEGSHLHGVNVLRSVNDSRVIKEQLDQASSIVIVGAGFIGLEVAAAAISMGKKVAVFDMADRVMGRAVAPQISTWFEAAHKLAGIDFYLEESISSIEGSNDRVSGVRRLAGEPIEAQMVLLGIGVVPNAELAETAGLDCNNGIVVDEFCRASEERVFAAGDCANHPNKFADGEAVRLESIQNATDQARVIAAGIVGQPIPYTAVPWFWSDQGEHSLQMAGLGQSADQFVTRGLPSSSSFSVFHYKGDRLLAVDSVNNPRDHMLARKLLAAGLSPLPEQAQTVDFELKSVLNKPSILNRRGGFDG